MAATFAAAEAHVPVVQPVRRPDVRSATSGESSGSIGLFDGILVDQSLVVRCGDNDEGGAPGEG